MKITLFLLLSLLIFQSRAGAECPSPPQFKSKADSALCEIEHVWFWQTSATNFICQSVATAEFSHEIYSPSAQRDYCRSASTEVMVLFPLVRRSRKVYMTLVSITPSPLTGGYASSVDSKYRDSISRGCLAGFEARKALRKKCNDDNYDLWDGIGNIKDRVSQ